LLYNEIKYTKDMKPSNIEVKMNLGKKDNFHNLINKENTFISKLSQNKSEIIIFGYGFDYFLIQLRESFSEYHVAYFEKISNLTEFNYLDSQLCFVNTRKEIVETLEIKKSSICAIYTGLKYLSKGKEEL